MGRFRQLLVFDRFLARVFQILGDRAILKGGLVLELRLKRARTTKDVDLRLTGHTGTLLDELQKAGALDLGDYLTFLVTVDKEHPLITGEGVPYEGQRFRVEPVMGGKGYGMPFGLDVGVADALVQPPEKVEGSAFLEFVGVSPGTFLIYPREAHVAEKLHAYTLPRAVVNTRVKDLPDLALLGQTGSLASQPLREAILATFAHRGTHPVPLVVPSPPGVWGPVYGKMVVKDGLPWGDLATLTLAVESFLNPVLSGVSGTWDPASWSWS